MTIDERSMKEKTIEKISMKEMSIDEMSTKEMTIGKMSTEEMCLDEMPSCRFFWKKCFFNLILSLHENIKNVFLLMLVRNGKTTLTITRCLTCR